MEGPLVLVFLLGAMFSWQNVMIQPAQGEKNDDSGLSERVKHLEIQLERLDQMEIQLKRLDQLEIKLEHLEVENEKLKEVCGVQSFDFSFDHDADLDNIDKSGNIEEDVAQNTGDIMSLKVEMYHHHDLINQGISDTKFLNLTLHYDIETLNDEIDDFKTEYNANNIYIEQTRPPLGSVIAWMPGFSETKDIPQGWQRCDGSTILTGPLTGNVTPDLNLASRFLRGGSDGQASQFQEDAIQDHTHVDEGHVHQDSGHSHTDSGHHHEFKDQPGVRDGMMYGHGTTSDGYDFAFTDSGDRSLRKWVYRTDTDRANIQTNYANIKSSLSGMSGVEEGRMADETRPKSMFVVYIIRIF